MNDNSHDIGVIVHSDRLVLKDVTIVNAEAAALVAAAVSESGPAGALDLIRRALPVGLVALQLGASSVDTGSLERTLSGFRAAVDRSAQAATDDLARTVAHLREGEQSILDAAQQVMTTLPGRIEAALAGEASTVRESVRAAAADVNAAALRDLREALTAHARQVRDAVSLDNDAGPVQSLRRDLLTQIDLSRAEIGGQVAALAAQMQAGAAAQQAARTSSRAVGDAWEAVSMAACRAVVTTAGDFFAETGSEAPPGTTRRTGDGVATIHDAAGSAPQRVCFEAKARSRRVMSASSLLKELQAAAANRQAQVAIAVVPSTAEVPGGGLLARLAPSYWVVAVEDGDQTALSLVYLVARELARAATVAHSGPAAAVIPTVSSHLDRALEALISFDAVRRHGVTAQRSIAELLTVGEQASERVLREITSASKALNQAARTAA